MTDSRKSWLSLSVAMNAVLAAALIVMSRPAGQRRGAKTPLPVRSASALRVTSTLVAPAHPTTNEAIAYVAALRAAGVPERLIAKVVVADFDDRWRRRIDELQARYAKGEVSGNELAALTRRREPELERELKAALGEESFRRWDEEQVVSALHLPAGALQPSEASAVYALRTKLRSQLRELEAAHDRGELDDDQFSRQFAAAQRKQTDQLQSLLGPERAQQMEVPSGDSDAELQHALRKINASDLQFETIVAVQKSWLAQRSEIESQLVQGDPQKAPALEDQLRALDAARDNEYQRVLGPKGFEMMQKEQDPRYATMERNAEAWQLDQKGADSIFRSVLYYDKVVQDYRAQARALENSGQAVDWNAVNQNLQQFSQQAEAALKSNVGADLFEKLKANHVLPFAEGK